MLDYVAALIDCSGTHIILTFIGFIATIYVMQMGPHVSEYGYAPTWLRWLARFGLALLAIGLLWSLRYGLQKAWQPWPPVLVVDLAIDVMMIARGLALSIKQRRHVRQWIPPEYLNKGVWR